MYTYLVVHEQMYYNKPLKVPRLQMLFIIIIIILNIYNYLNNYNYIMEIIGPLYVYCQKVFLKLSAVQDY